MSREIVIEADGSMVSLWRDLWAYRDLLVVLSLRDIMIRYKQTVIGAMWAVIRPLLVMVVFTVVFGRIANLSSGDKPYYLMVFAGMLPWQFFASAMYEGGNSLVVNSELVSKVYFPRMIIPLSSVAACAVDFVVSLFLFLGLLVFEGVEFSWRFLCIFPVFLQLMVLSSGVGLLLSAFNVRYRDVRYIIPFIVQFGMYVSPVGFSTEIVPNQWLFLYQINPLVGIIDTFRWVFWGGSLPVSSLMSSLFLTLFFWVAGSVYFRRSEKIFADVI